MKKFNRFEMLDDDGKLSADKVSNFLIEAHGIKYIEGQLSVYEDGAYLSNERKIEILIDKYLPTITERTLQAIMCKVRRRAPEYDNQKLKAFTHLICFKNGLYDIKTDKLIPFSMDYIVPNKIHWNYNPDAYSEDIDKALEGIACGDPEIRALLEEIFGYCMYRDLSQQIAFVLVGPGGNGKSTFTDIIITLLGHANISAVKLHQFASDKDKFTVADLVGKLANIGDDISDEYIPDTSNFKSATSGELIRARQIYGKPFLFKSYATMIFSAQNMPRIRSYDDGWFRRIREVPLNANFKHDSSNCDPDLKDRINKGDDVMMSYVINLGLAGLQRVLTKGFTTPAACVKAKEEYIKECNPTLEWAEEFLEKHRSFHMLKRDDVYRDYQMWANKAGQKAMSQNVFVRFIKGHFNVEVENKYHTDEGKGVRTFVEKEP